MCAPDTSPCGGTATADDGESVLPANPFTALQFHFGMLLGVDDLEVSQAYPRGKMRLHNAWLHRDGVVWGFDVYFKAPRYELAVTPGLALDAAGHELHLDTEACVDLGKWYARNKDTYKDDPAFTVNGDGSVTFTVHVVARFRACLSRQVPAISAPCADGETDTAYSRALETVELLLRPGKAPSIDRHYHRLRILFGLEVDQQDSDGKWLRPEATAARAEVLMAPNDPDVYLNAFRKLAALDEIELEPQHAANGVSASIFPEDPTEVPLADVEGIQVRPTTEGGFAIDTKAIPTPNVTVRPSHVATATIQELTWLPLLAAAAGGGPPSAFASGGPPAGTPTPAPAPRMAAASAGSSGGVTGPRVESVSLGARSIQFAVDRPLAPASLKADAFSVTAYDDDDGWTEVGVGRVTVDGGGQISVALKAAPKGRLVRFIARGTGPTPLIANDNLAPLGASAGGVNGTNDGVDFVHVISRQP